MAGGAGEGWWAGERGEKGWMGEKGWTGERGEVDGGMGIMGRKDLGGGV